MSYRGLITNLYPNEYRIDIEINYGLVAANKIVYSSDYFHDALSDFMI